MAFACDIEHTALLDIMPMPRLASCHATGYVNGDKRFTTAWVTKHLRQAIALNVVIHNPIDLAQLQTVCSAELKRQLVTHWASYALNLLFDRIEALQAVQVIEVCWFVVHHVRLPK